MSGRHVMIVIEIRQLPRRQVWVKIGPTGPGAPLNEVAISRSFLFLALFPSFKTSGRPCSPRAAETVLDNTTSSLCEHILLN